ncbi:hypothetical protein PR048_009041 [Dryococelus australis]|uniref:Uncharacterized protein n=1 Tax=Dryococelus australis TaxID=614101 RepID=A0ABQ9HYS7_9NEOP|nr:hypothetical protein PR048_009041 [Dryococelus australis]
MYRPSQTPRLASSLDRITRGYMQPEYTPQRHKDEGRPQVPLSAWYQEYYDESARMKGRGKQEIPEKTRRPMASSGENPVTRPGIEPGSPWWEANDCVDSGGVENDGEFLDAQAYPSTTLATSVMKKREDAENIDYIFPE